MVVCTKHSASLIDLNDSIAGENFFSTTINSTANRIGGKIIKFENASVPENEKPAKDARIEVYKKELNGDNYMTMRIYAKENKHYMLQAITEKGKHEESISKFLNSFKFLSQKKE